MNQKTLIPLLACFLVPLAGVSTDIYLPSLPALTHYFSTSKSLVALTVTVFALSSGIMQLLAGPVCDALGRKKLFVVALLLQALSVLVILIAPSIMWVIVSRLLQGVGCAFVSVPARAILTDVFDGDLLKKHFNRLALAFALGPIMAPFIGGYLQHFFGWHACFIFILGYVSLALLLVLFLYKESSVSLQTFSTEILWKNYHQIIQHRHFMVGCLLTTCLIAPTMFFNVAGPFLIQVAMKKTAVDFGHLALFVGLAWFLGSLTNQQLFHIKPHIKIWYCVALMPLVALSMLFLSARGMFSLWLLMLPILAMVYLCGGFFSLMVAECLTMFKTMVASVNALFFSMVWVGVSASSAIATMLEGQTLVRMAIALSIMSLLCLGLYIIFSVQLGRSQASS